MMTMLRYPSDARMTIAFSLTRVYPRRRHNTMYLFDNKKVILRPEYGQYFRLVPSLAAFYLGLIPLLQPVNLYSLRQICNHHFKNTEHSHI
jgi:hypothetical protein